jgi:Holliday junction resolvasome RuvABC endonuclease subunit
MSLGKIVNNIKPTRLISIDPASHSLAWVVVDLDKDSFEIVEHGKINISGTKEVSEKFKIINKELHDICDMLCPDKGVIEQSVYIQNFQSSRIISYIIGFSWGVMMRSCHDVCDVGPLIWKNKIGYKNVSALEKSKLEKDFGKKGLQTKLKNERKDRVKAILDQKINYSVDDDDINDAIGIALWYSLSHGFRTI